MTASNYPDAAKLAVKLFGVPSVRKELKSAYYHLKKMKRGRIFSSPTTIQNPPTAKNVFYTPLLIFIMLFSGCSPDIDKLILNKDSARLIQCAKAADFEKDGKSYSKIYMALSDICDDNCRKFLHNRYAKSNSTGEKKFLLTLLPTCHTTETVEFLLAEILNRVEMEEDYDDILLAIKLIDNSLLSGKVSELLRKAREAADKSPDAARIFLLQATSLAPLAAMEREVAEEKGRILMAARKHSAVTLAREIVRALDEGDILSAYYMAKELDPLVKDSAKAKARELLESLRALKAIEDAHFEAAVKAEGLFKEISALKEKLKELKSRSVSTDEIRGKISELTTQWHSTRGDVVIASRAMNRLRPRLQKLKFGYEKLAEGLGE
ncbi:MAG: hypothetical protein Kow0090_06610 [Myxococcota bacterium]